METTTTPARSEGMNRPRRLLSLLIVLFAIYFIAQIVVVNEVWTPTGPYDHIEGAQPHRVTTWVSVSMFGRSFSLPVFTRSGMKDTQFE